MKVLSAQDIRAADAYTIKHEPIVSTDLMERAAAVFVKWFCDRFGASIHVTIICGIGNNGGDGLAAARMLFLQGYSVRVIVCNISDYRSDDFRINFKRLCKPENEVPAIHTINKEDRFPEFIAEGVIVDAIFGSGLNRAIEGYWAELLTWINQCPVPVIAIDIPSGLFADRPSTGAIIEADQTLSFELPKLAFFAPENENYIGDWETSSIGLHPDFLAGMKPSYEYVDQTWLQNKLPKRRKFDHKGKFGHALLIAGSYGKIGAAILASRAALRSGLGLLTVHVPGMGYQAVQSSVPEAMVEIDDHDHVFSFAREPEAYVTVGIGCGIGMSDTTIDGLEKLLLQCSHPLVLDADALNIIASRQPLIEKIPFKSILTPHLKEFERLFGRTDNHFDRLKLLRKSAQDHNLIIVLKGAHTAIALPDGLITFNSTGNPGMATAGSGDVLTGIITGILAQQYEPETAAIIGTHVHGLAGDLAAEMRGYEALIASDIIDSLGLAFKKMHNY